MIFKGISVAKNCLRPESGLMFLYYVFWYKVVETGKLLQDYKQLECKIFSKIFKTQKRSFISAFSIMKY